MAVLLIDQITNGDIRYLVLDSDPSADGGYEAPSGSFAHVPSLNAVFQKTGSLDTDWAKIVLEGADFTEAVQDAVGNILTDTSTVNFTYNDAGDQITADVIQSGIDHGSIGGLADDDHAQYALLAGRTGGQNLRGGSASAENLTISSTSNSTKGSILIGAVAAVDEANTRLGMGTQSPEQILHLKTSNADFQVKQGSSQTVGAVTSDLITLSVANNSAAFIKAYVIGTDSVALGTAVYERTIRVKNVAGVVTTSIVQSDWTNEDTGMSAANAAFVVSGTNLILRVTGVAAKTINWKASFQIVK